VEIISFIWNAVLVNPMANALVLLNNVFFGSFGLSIIVLTVFMRGITFPLTLRQLRSSRALSAMQGRLQEIQKKYKDPKRRSEETMKIYREAGVNPLGCILPMVAQIPIWIALYQVIRLTVGDVPESTINLSRHLYPWSFIQQAVPLSDKFLGLSLGAPNLPLALMVGASMFVQQKMTSPPSLDERSASMNSTMLWMMPLMFTYFAISFPSGLALYWVISSVVSVVLQYIYVGSGGLTWKTLFSLQPAKTAATKLTAPTPKAEPEDETDEADDAAEAVGDERHYRKRSRRGKRRRKR
jgi:membrane protein insertase, YidC/Oxa1 family, C-terminal domain